MVENYIGTVAEMDICLCDGVANIITITHIHLSAHNHFV